MTAHGALISCADACTHPELLTGDVPRPTAVALSGNGTTLAYSTDAHSVTVVTFATGTPIKVQIPTAPTALALGHAGRRVAVATGGKDLIMIDIPSRSLTLASTSLGTVTAAALLGADGTTMVASGIESAVETYNLSTGALHRFDLEAKTTALSSDGHGESAVVGLETGIAITIDPEGHLRRFDSGQSSPLAGVSASTNYLAAVAADGSTYRWPARPQYPRSATVIADGVQNVSVSNDGSVALIHMRSGDLKVRDASGQLRDIGPVAEATALAVADGAQDAAVADATGRVISTGLNSGVHSQVRGPDARTVTALAYTASALAVGLDDGTIELHRNDGTHRQATTGSAGIVNLAASATNTSALAWMNQVGAFGTLDLSTLQVETYSTLTEPSNTLVLGDDGSVVVGTNDGALQVWRSHRLRQAVSVHTDKVVGAQPAGRSAWWISASEDETIAVSSLARNPARIGLSIKLPDGGDFSWLGKGPDASVLSLDGHGRLVAWHLTPQQLIATACLEQHTPDSPTEQLASGLCAKGK